MKVVINRCYGGFGLSPEATLKLWQLGAEGLDVTPIDEYWPPEKREEEAEKYPTLGYQAAIDKWREYLAGTKKGRDIFLTVFTPDEQFVVSARDVTRSDQNLLKVLEEMGAEAHGDCADLSVVEIPDGVEWEIEEYDGREWVAEKHRTWS